MKHILFTGINGPRNMAKIFSAYILKDFTYTSHVYLHWLDETVQIPKKMVNAKIEHSIN